MTEQTKNFLLYGIEAHIKPKEIYKLDVAMLFFIFGLFFLAEASPGPVFSKIFLVLVYLGMVILSFSRTEVTGKKVFWIYGIQSLGFSLLFCWAGTILMLTTLEEKYYPGYLAALVLLYILVIALYILLTLALIKKDVYNPSTSKKMAGGWCVTVFVILGISAAKILSAQAGYTATIRFASLSSYFISLLCILGAFHLVKYFMIKKWEKTDNNKRKDIRV